MEYKKFTTISITEEMKQRLFNIKKKSMSWTYEHVLKILLEYRVKYYDLKKKLTEKSKLENKTQNKPENKEERQKFNPFGRDRTLF